MYILKNKENDVIEIKNIGDDKVRSVAIDSKDNIYIGTDDSAFICEKNQTNAKRITEINEFNSFVYSVVVDKKDNVYFGTKNGLYKSSDNGKNIIKINEINEIIYTMIIDSNDNIYIGTRDNIYFLNQNKINKINSTDNIKYSYFSLIFFDKNNTPYFIN
ncbi:hypothetical protein [Spiroplasma endosymbiont of Agriotes lineatus]|uniref:hypothetical protein n=1 Tax=Spiroplasma endosymbiont of Agriotes lineatus TaxID=3077930 RepID=UPI0030CE2D16